MRCSRRQVNPSARGCAIPNPVMRQTGDMSSGTDRTGWLLRTGREALGWILIPVGIVLWPAPGPGTLVLLAAFTLLAPRYAWARWVLG